MCDDIVTTGLVKTSKDADDTDVENEVYRRVLDILLRVNAEESRALGY